MNNTLSSHLLMVACLFALGAVGCGGDEPAVESDPSELSAPADPSDPTSVDDPSSPSTDASDPVEPGSACEAWEQAGSTTWHADTFAALSDGVSVNPVETVLPEDTTGTLSIGLHPDVVPVMSATQGVLAAASKLGDGRVVAFSGQDFLSSQTRSTLLGDSDIDQLVRNAVAWVGNQSSLAEMRVLTDNDVLTALLSEQGYGSVETTFINFPQGLWTIRDWDASALEGVDVVVAQVNEWGTLHIAPEHIATLRAFVEAGGGLVLAGSALHWSWWLSDTAAEFHGDLLLEGSGIRFDAVSRRDLTSAQVSSDLGAAPEELWCRYVLGRDVSELELPQLTGLFSAAVEANRAQDVQEALGRLIEETPNLPVSAANPYARLSADVAASIAPVDWPAAHPWTETFPGLAADGSAIESENVTVDLSYSKAQPLGFYAGAGQVVRVTVPAELQNAGYSIQVGERFDDLRNLDHIETWRRAPMLYRNFPINAEVTEVSNVLGGSLYLVVPAGQTGTVRVGIGNAVPMVVYTTREFEPEDWAAAIETNPAPMTILQERGQVRLVVGTDAAKQVTTPDDVIAFWTGFQEHHMELAQEPTERRFESHWIFDTQVGWGYANATSDRITYPMIAEAWALRTRTGDEDWWLFGHELGHQFQTSDWTGGDVTEVCVNLFTMYTLNDYIFGGHGFETQGFNPNTIDNAALESYRWATADLFGKLQLYRQLVFEFGWEVMREVFASYYSPEFSRGSHGSFMDGFAIRMSVITQRDLADFFEHWEYPMSSSAAATIRGYGFENWLPEGW
ncbi:MAG: M60 family metallopeptidase [Myxococcota bacterium]|nr:M60 family metallopeptidase [Myxococcota bacterium]